MTTPIGCNSSATTTVSLPAGTAAGDLCIVLAARAAASPPSKPAAFTDITSDSSAIWSARSSYKVLTAGDITAGNVGTWTSASIMIVGIYRGTITIGAASSVLAVSPNGTTQTFPARTGLNAAVDWQVALGAHTTSTINTSALTGYTNRSSGNPNGRAGLWDSNGGTSGIAQQTLSPASGNANIGVTVALLGPSGGSDPMGRSGFFGI